MLKKSRSAILSSLRGRLPMWIFKKKTDKPEPMKLKTTGNSPIISPKPTTHYQKEIYATN